MTKEIISTPLAPQAIGTYSQAIKVDHTVYLSGQIPLVPETMTIIAVVNEIMGHYFEAPYPARAVVGVAALPKDVGVEMDAIMFLKVQEYPI
ncbi:MAG: Rid family hydrolase [Methylococcales bacterium]|nr:Rid family hydrolase [Methylococcales bacterium]